MTPPKGPAEKRKKPSAASIGHLGVLHRMPWLFLYCDYQVCRFCGIDGFITPEHRLWKYAERHYCCERCRIQYTKK